MATTFGSTTGLLSVAAVLACAAASRADFQFSNVRTSFSVDGTSYDRVTFFARNDGTGRTLGGTKLQGMDINVSSTGVMRFERGHVNDSFIPNPSGPWTFYESDPGLDIVLTAPTALLAANGALHTKLLGETFTDDITTLIPAKPSNTSKGGFNAVAAYANLRTFNAVGVALGTSNAVPAGTGLGAAFASVVTTPGASVTVSGQIGGDTGTAGPVSLSGLSAAANVSDAAGLSAAPVAAATVLLPYSYTAVVPEPTTAAALASTLALLGRRMRRR